MLSALEQRQATGDEDHAQEDQPGFGREEEGADGDGAEDQQHKTDILGFLVDLKASFFTKIVVHSSPSLQAII